MLILATAFYKSALRVDIPITHEIVDDDPNIR